MVPIGLALGRFANFINGELWGRATHAGWGMIYPHVDQQLRYPSQIFECMGEGGVLFCVLWSLRKHFQKPGQMSQLFLLGYGLIRYALEFMREPDAQMHWLPTSMTMGQWLSY